jgi:hypothetical protein
MSANTDPNGSAATTDPARNEARFAQDSRDGQRSAGSPAAGPRRRGRPALMTREQVLDQIRGIMNARDGLFRVHHAHAGLYARARRMFGSWAAAVSAAGVDYPATIARARERAILSRSRAARRRFRLGA